MAFLFESFPFELTFNILFRYGGFDALEHGLGGRKNCCWEFLKLMNHSRRAELLCICRTVQLLDHPAHALFLLNYPPDSSIPENRRAWNVARMCCIGWKPDVRSVVLAMRAFIQPFPRFVFPWLDAADLSWRRSEDEWRAIGRQQQLSYRFNEWWWNDQREAFQLERAEAGSDMGTVIRGAAKAEMGRLMGALTRREKQLMLERKQYGVWKKQRQAAVDQKLRMQGSDNGNKKRKLDTAPPPPIKIVLNSEDKKKAAEQAKEAHAFFLAVLQSAKQALEGVYPHVFETKLHKAAKLVASLCKQNPLIKWNLSLLFHTAAGETGLTVWETELLLQKCRWGAVVGHDALGRLGALCAP
jgi:hypothetical protein